MNYDGKEVNPGIRLQVPKGHGLVSTSQGLILCPFIGNTSPLMGIGNEMNQKIGNKNKKKTEKEQAIGTTENVGNKQNKKGDNENGIGKK